MQDGQSTRMDDAQLLGILDEIATWRVIGERGTVLFRVPSLLEAIKAAVTHELQGFPVRAIAREPDNNVIVFSGQLERLAQAIGYGALASFSPGSGDDLIVQ